MEFKKPSPKKERAAQKESYGDPQRIPLKFSAEFLVAYDYGELAWGKGKNHLKGTDT